MLKLTYWNSHIETRIVKPACRNSHVATPKTKPGRNGQKPKGCALGPCPPPPPNAPFKNKKSREHCYDKKKWVFILGLALAPGMGLGLGPHPGTPHELVDCFDWLIVWVICLFDCSVCDCLLADCLIFWLFDCFDCGDCVIVWLFDCLGQEPSGGWGEGPLHRCPPATPTPAGLFWLFDCLFDWLLAC